MALDDFFKHTIGGLVPPGETAPPQRQLVWRWYMYVAVMFLIGATFLDHGALPSVYQGMARVTDVTQQQRQLQDFQADWTSQALLTLFLQQCEVKDQQTWQLYQVKINELERKYFQLTGQPWPPPVCPKR